MNYDVLPPRSPYKSPLSQEVFWDKKGKKNWKMAFKQKQVGYKMQIIKQNESAGGQSS